LVLWQFSYVSSNWGACCGDPHKWQLAAPVAIRGVVAGLVPLFVDVPIASLQLNLHRGYGGHRPRTTSAHLFEGGWL
jgi:hypothetical protein